MKSQVLAYSPVTSVINSPWSVTVKGIALAAGNASQHAVKPDIGLESQFLPTPPAFDTPLGGSPSEYCYAVWRKKTRMMDLPDCEKFLTICLLVLTQFTNVTDKQTNRHTDRHRMTA